MTHYGRPLTISGNYCMVHGYHYPKPLRTVRHHVWALSDGGPDEAENEVLVCDTGHYDIHFLLDKLKRTGGQAGLVVGGTREERRLAQLGYDRFMRRAM